MRGADASDDDGAAPTLTAASPVTPADTLPGPPAAFQTASTQVPAAPQGRLAEGALVGRYELVERLGAGAMGVVWAATDPQLDRKVAIKVVHPNLARAPDAATRLLREARAMAKLSHRAVVTVHDAGEAEGQLFVAMELVRGTTLGALLRERTAHGDWRKWFAMARDAGRGLAAAHEGGVLHRDFKPDNVLVGISGRVCVADFGLATLGPFSPAVPGMEDEAARRSTYRAMADAHLTQTGALLGTPAYMSPEQLRGEVADARSDQFSFCVAMWEALYGARPYTTTALGVDAVVALAEAIASGPPPSPVDTTVPAPIGEVLRRGLATKPRDRFPDMTALLDALDESAATASMPHGVPSPVTAPVETQLVRKHSRSRVALVLSLAGAIGLVATMIAVVSRDRAHPTASLPALAHGPQLPHYTSTRLYGVPVQAAVALSPDGKRLAIGELGVEVRELGNGDPTAAENLAHWRHIGATDRSIGTIAFDHGQIVYSMVTPAELVRWDYAGTDQATSELKDFPGQWLGETAAGALLGSQGEQKLRIFRDGTVVQEWPTSVAVAVTAISPDGRHVAYIEETRTTGVIILYDVVTKQSFTSVAFIEPTALGWRDDHTLMFATGTQYHPKIWSLPVGDHAFGTPSLVYMQPTGWFSRLLVHGRTIYAVEVDPSPKARVIETATGQSHELEGATATAPLGWIDDQTFYVWNRRMGHIDIRTPARPVAVTQLALDDEPVNATMTKDLLIVAVRREGGRQVVAYRRTDGTIAWQSKVGELLAVRCAGDVAAPCFAIQVERTRGYVVPIDLATGAVSNTILFSGPLEDVAVRADGKAIAAVGRTNLATEIDLATSQQRTFVTPLSSVRSIAYRNAGGFVVAGTLGATTYQFGRIIDGQYTLSGTTEGELLMLVRESPAATNVHVLARVYDSSLYQLEPAQ